MLDSDKKMRIEINASDYTIENIVYKVQEWEIEASRLSFEIVE